MATLIDTHCHLDLFKDIQIHPQSENALEIKTISVTNAPSFYQHNCKLFEGLDNIRVALGLHPQLIGQYAADVNLFDQFIGSTKYIGEIGLDGSLDLKKTYPVQLKVFETIVKCASLKGDKLLTVHSRNAASETIEILNRHLKKSSCSVILHWFSGNKAELSEGIKSQFYFSINHRMVDTDKGKDIIRNIPNHLLLTETDAPFTFSAGIKDRRDSIQHTLRSIAVIKGLSYDACQDLVFQNFKRSISF